MQLSSSRVVKRFAWLWGAVLGTVFFYLLVEIGYYGFSTLFPPPKTVSGFVGTGPGVTRFSINPPNVSLGLSQITKACGVWGSGIGCCCAMLWVGQRSWVWRLSSLLVGVGTLSCLAWILWSNWRVFTPSVPSWKRWDGFVYAAMCAPLVLGSLLLLFFALVLRSSRTLRTEL